jgi:hypothetical protein
MAFCSISSASAETCADASPTRSNSKVSTISAFTYVPGGKDCGTACMHVCMYVWACVQVRRMGTLYVCIYVCVCMDMRARREELKQCVCLDVLMDVYMYVWWRFARTEPARDMARSFYKCMYACMCLYMYVNNLVVDIRPETKDFICMYEYIYIYIYICIIYIFALYIYLHYIYIYIYIYAHTHTETWCMHACI